MTTWAAVRGAIRHAVVSRACREAALSWAQRSEARWLEPPLRVVVDGGLVFEWAHRVSRVEVDGTVSHGS